MTAFKPFITIARSRKTGPEQKSHYRAYFARLLSDHLGLPIHIENFRNLESGQLVLDLGQSSPAIHLSVSHSQSWIALSACPFAPWGIDLEFLPKDQSTRKLQGIAKKAFWDSEFQTWEKLPKTRQIQAFYELWVKKESSSKAFGLGIAQRKKELVWEKESVDLGWTLAGAEASRYNDQFFEKEVEGGTLYFNHFCSTKISNYFPNGLFPGFAADF